MPKRRRKLGPFIGPGGVRYDTYHDLRKAIDSEYRDIEHVRTLNDPGTEDIGRPALQRPLRTTNNGYQNP